MKSKIYSNSKLIGTSELQVTNESSGLISGKFIPTENYEKIRNIVWRSQHSNSDEKSELLKKLRINCQLENEVFLHPVAGFLIIDHRDRPKENLEFEAAGNYKHVIEDNFLSNPPKERIFEPWEHITIEQKISYEDELFKEIGKIGKKGILNFYKSKEHKLKRFEFGAIANSIFSDDILFAINEKGENEFKYAVIHLTWKGKLESNDDFPRIEFFENFDHFLYYKLYPDKADWED